MSPTDVTLYRAVDEVLHYIWDPIGVSAAPQAREEYYGYIPHLFGLLASSASEEKIAVYLGDVTTERMGLSANPVHDLKVARILINWKEAVDENLA